MYCNHLNMSFNHLNMSKKSDKVINLNPEHHAKTTQKSMFRCTY